MTTDVKTVSHQQLEVRNIHHKMLEYIHVLEERYEPILLILVSKTETFAFTSKFDVLRIS